MSAPEHELRSALAVPSVAPPLRVGLAGLGTVGAGLFRLLTDHAGLITARAGRAIVVTAVSARDRSRDRGVDLSAVHWESDAVALAARGDVDVVVELIGGADGPALALARAVVRRGKSLVTANKALLACHGAALATEAEAAGAPLRMEAAVAGGVPIIETLLQGTAANAVDAVSGVLNGTSNYILSRMERHGLEFDDVLADAQRLGYAEADPSFDVDGIDAAHKLTLLAALAFGTAPHLDGTAITGIRQITTLDIAYATSLGYRVRLVGLARREPDGSLFQRVGPCLVPAAHPLARLDGATNAVAIDARPLGRLVLEGPGAGAGPTASAVAADLITIARGANRPVFGVPATELAATREADPGSHVGRHYVRVDVADRPGMLAALTAALARAGVSIASLLQREPRNADVAVTMVTHAGPERALAAAVAAIAALDGVRSAPTVMQILES